MNADQGTVFEVYPVKPQTSANNDTEKSRLWSRRLRAKARTGSSKHAELLSRLARKYTGSQ